MRITIMIDQSYQNPTNGECTIEKYNKRKYSPSPPRGKEVSHLGGHRPMKQDQSPFGHKLNANKTIDWYPSLGTTIFGNYTKILWVFSNFDSRYNVSIYIVYSYLYEAEYIHGRAWVLFYLVI